MIREKFLSADEARNIGLEKLPTTFKGGPDWAAIPQVLAPMSPETARICFKHCECSLG